MLWSIASMADALLFHLNSGTPLVNTTLSSSVTGAPRACVAGQRYAAKATFFAREQEVGLLLRQEPGSGFSSRPSNAPETPMSTHDSSKSSHPEDHRKRGVSRRLFLKSSSAALASTAVMVPIAAQEASPAASPVTQDQSESFAPAVEFFNPHEAELVDAITARILPGTADDPGAREAGVVYFIDRSIAGTNEGFTLKTYAQGPYLQVNEDQATVESTSRTDIYRVVETPSDQVSRYGFQSVLNPQDIYRRGLEFVDAYAQTTFNDEFLNLSEQQQDQILVDMDADEATGFDAPSGKAFFTRLRNDTIEGMFSDPMYGGNRNMVGWKLIGYPGARGFYTSQDMANPSFTAEPISLADMTGHGH
jgi:gluconate 2-dehydrogenase gamma chain